MKDEQPTGDQYQLIELSDGQTIPVASAPMLKLGFITDNAHEVARHDLDVSRAEFQTIAKKAATHTVNFDTISKEITYMHKITKHRDSTK